MLLEKKKHYLKPPSRVRAIQKSMPGARLYESGMMGFGSHLYSSTYRIKDTDFSSGSEEDQEDFFMAYSDILNSLDSKDTTYKLTLFNRNINYLKTDYRLLQTDIGDGYDPLRQEYNMMRKRNRAKASGLVKERYLTVTVDKARRTGRKSILKDLGRISARGSARSDLTWRG